MEAHWLMRHCTQSVDMHCPAARTPSFSPRSQSRNNMDPISPLLICIPPPAVAPSSATFGLLGGYGLYNPYFGYGGGMGYGGMGYGGMGYGGMGYGGMGFGGMGYGGMGFGGMGYAGNSAAVSNAFANSVYGEYEHAMEYVQSRLAWYPYQVKGDNFCKNAFNQVDFLE